MKIKKICYILCCVLLNFQPCQSAPTSTSRGSTMSNGNSLGFISRSQTNNFANFHFGPGPSGSKKSS